MSFITVVGAGYVGLVSGTGFAELGHQVTCIEINPGKLATLQSGRLTIHEPGLDKLFAKHTAAGSLSFTCEYEAAIPNAEFVFLAVDTPAMDDGQADTSKVLAAANSVFNHAGPDLILVLKSTVPVGTGDKIRELAAQRGARIRIVSNPEFLSQGTAVRDFFEPDRIVVGSSDSDAAAQVARLYSQLERPVINCSQRSAELAKYASNAFLATRLSFVNEISMICDALGADIEEVARITGLDHRIGPHYLRAGVGWGGSCLPKDVSALKAMAMNEDVEPRMLIAASRTNDDQRARAIKKLVADLGSVEGKVITILGLSFKPNTDDLRGAPALPIARALVAMGARVKSHDPVAIDRARELLTDVEYHEDVYDAVADADAILLATEWVDYVQLDWQKVRQSMSGNVLVDGRNALDMTLMTGLGFSYSSFGRGTPNERLNGSTLLAYPVASESAK